MSTVVLSNLPMGCIESDIHRALLMYGTAVSIEMNSHSSQATVTMRTKQEAQALLNRRSVNVIGTSVRVDAQMQAPPPQQQLQQQPQSFQQQQMVPQSSQHLQQQQMGSYGYGSGNGGQQPQSTYGNMAVQQFTQHDLNHQPQHPQQQYAQKQHPQQMPLQSQPQGTGGYMPCISHRGSGSGQSIMPAPPQPSRRLRVLVEDCRYPITRDVLMQMFSMIAPPVSVSCGPYGPTTTGAVEFAEAAAAQQAMDQFHNNAIYPNCCYVKLYFEPMWDRADPAQPPLQLHQPYSYGDSNSGYSSLEQGPANAPPSMQANPYSGASHTPTRSGMYGAGWGGSDDAQYCSDSTPSSAAPQSQPPLHSQPGQLATDSFARGSGDGGTGSDFANKNSVVQRGAENKATRGVTPPQIVRGGRGISRGGIGGRGNGPGLGAATGFSPFEPSGRPPARGGGAGAVRYPGSETNGCTLMVSCVSESVPLYDLWVLLEVFGNVNSLKRQFRDRTNVVAQFQHPGDTLTAIQYLQHCPFRGSVLRLKRFSGYQERETEWETKSATDPATQAALFTTGYHHRTAPRAPVNVRGRVHPDKNLYITNLTEGISDDELKGIMKEAGFEPDAFFRRGPKGAIVAYKDTETAVDALIALHAKEVRERFLRVTFSRFPPGPRPSRDGVDKGDEDDDGDAEPCDGPQETQSELPQQQQQQGPHPSPLNGPVPHESAKSPAPEQQGLDRAPEEVDGGKVQSPVSEAALKAEKIK
ncbi:hypothetical protein, conserved [Leishmania tarentolae]|uniref:RRM domain-containing protein n=1 Tax=Leishmania tarentolae TaxID=5689 RepID=A0A640KV43_LEITA|nr:hypothetical protein, conserved [Leishmania tarentolae]